MEWGGVFIVHEDRKTSLRWFSSLGLSSRHTGVWQTPQATDGCHTSSEHIREVLHQSELKSRPHAELEKRDVPASNGQDISPAQGSGNAELKLHGQ